MFQIKNKMKIIFFSVPSHQHLLRIVNNSSIIVWIQCMSNFFVQLKQLIIDQEMGQCQTQKSEARIDVLHIPAHQLRSDIPLETCLYTQPQRNLHIKHMNQQNKMETQLKGTKLHQLTLVDENSQQIIMESKKYDYLSPGILFQNQGLQITQILTDQLHCDRLIYLVKKNRENYGLLIRNFNDFYSQEFMNTLYEINTYERIASINSPYLHKIIRNYTIESINDYKFVTHNSKVIFLQPVTANLSLIIKHRRQHRISWRVTEFYVLMKHLVEAVAALHEAGLVHNDIRPSNIYYCKQKNGFVLGSFSNVTYASAAPQEPSKRKEFFYKDLKKRKVSIFISSFEESNKKSDIYSLGMSLLAAFYLILLIDRKKAAPHNRFYKNDYPFLEIINMMICKIQKRSNIFEIREKLKQLEKTYNLQGIDTVNLGEYSEIAKDYIDIYKRQRFIADGYKMLSLVGNWKQRLKNHHIHKKVSDNSVESAKYYEQLAVISYIQGKIQKSKNFYIHSAQIFYNVGTCNFIERDFQNAITYFQQGIDNFKIIENKQSELTYIKLLVSLFQSKIISGYQLIGAQELAKLWRLITGIKQVQPFAFWQYAQQLINIYKYYQYYNKIYDLLQICLEVSPHIQTKIGPITLERMIIENNLKLAELKNRQSCHRKAIISQTELSIFTMLNDKQYYFISHPLQKLQLIILSAKIKSLQGATREAIDTLLEIANSLQVWKNADENVDNIGRNKSGLLKCLVFTELGDIWLSLQEIEESFKYYSKAAQNYKEYYGDIYNIESAMLLQKMALIYKKQKQLDKYADSIDLVLKILKTEYGKYHKDILRLNQGYAKENRQNKHSIPFLNNFSRSQTDLQSITSI